MCHTCAANGSRLQNPSVPFLPPSCARSTFFPLGVSAAGGGFARSLWAVLALVPPGFFFDTTYICSRAFALLHLACSFALNSTSPHSRESTHHVRCQEVLRPTRQCPQSDHLLYRRAGLPVSIA